jgi:hypothetical protein
MRISESRIRKIIREEARRTLREADDGVEAGADKDKVLETFRKLGVRSMPLDRVRIMLEGYEEAITGSGDLSGQYPGFSKENFKDLMRLLINEIGVNGRTMELLDNNVEFDG